MFRTGKSIPKSGCSARRGRRGSLATRSSNRWWLVTPIVSSNSRASYSVSPPLHCTNWAQNWEIGASKITRIFCDSHYFRLSILWRHNYKSVPKLVPKNATSLSGHFRPLTSAPQFHNQCPLNKWHWHIFQKSDTSAFLKCKVQVSARTSFESLRLSTYITVYKRVIMLPARSFSCIWWSALVC